METPTMGHIIQNPKYLVEYLVECGWIYESRANLYLYSGKNTDIGVLLDYDFASYLVYHLFEIDSANYDFYETYYYFDIEKFRISECKIDGNKILEMVNRCLSNIKEENKTKYLKEYRVKKLKRLIYV